MAQQVDLLKLKGSGLIGIMWVVWIAAEYLKSNKSSAIFATAIIFTIIYLFLGIISIVIKQFNEAYS